MNPLEAHERVQSERKRIADNLAHEVSADRGAARLAAYERAYRELNTLALWASFQLADQDPVTGLIPRKGV